MPLRLLQDEDRQETGGDPRTGNADIMGGQDSKPASGHHVVGCRLVALHYPTLERHTAYLLPATHDVDVLLASTPRQLRPVPESPRNPVNSGSRRSQRLTSQSTSVSLNTAAQYYQIYLVGKTRSAVVLLHRYFCHAPHAHCSTIIRVMTAPIRSCHFCGSLLISIS